MDNDYKELLVTLVIYYLENYYYQHLLELQVILDEGDNYSKE
jgi:hypothetical protein